MELVGEKIVLRDWILDDLETYAYWLSGEHEWMKFDGPYYPKPTKPELEARIASYRENIAANDWPTPRKNLVIADAKSQKLLGTISWYWQSEATNWMSIGLSIYDDKHWGKSIGYEALRLWIDYLFECNNKLVRLDLRTWSGNIGMMKLAQKLGFKEEARFRDARVVDGKFYDGIGMGILKREWLENKSNSLG